MSESRGGGIGILGVLGIVFITLKLVGVINWSWWWVLGPYWIPFAVLVAIGIPALIVAAIIDGTRK